MGRGLLAASHPGPSLVVVVVVVGLGVAAGLRGGVLALLAVAIAAGQASIGFANDWVDGRAGRDLGRVDKPVATGAVSVGAVRTAALASAGVCVVASLGLGVIPAAWHLLAVAGGWAYDLRLKATSLSAVPYAVSFGLLPVIVAATAGASAAPWWAIATAALFGAGIHFANALPDLAQDAATGVRGLPQRLGARTSVLACTALLGAGAAVVLVAPGGGGVLVVVGAVASAGLLAGVLVTGLRGAHETAYRLGMLLGLLVVGVLVARGDALS